MFTGAQDAELCRSWGVEGFPATFVLDGAGVIRAKGLRGPELESCVDGLVAELRQERR